METKTTSKYEKISGTQRLLIITYRRLYAHTRIYLYIYKLRTVVKLEIKIKKSTFIGQVIYVKIYVKFIKMIQ